MSSTSYVSCRCLVALVADAWSRQPFPSQRRGPSTTHCVHASCHESFHHDRHVCATRQKNCLSRVLLHHHHRHHVHGGLWPQQRRHEAFLQDHANCPHLCLMQSAPRARSKCKVHAVRLRVESGPRSLQYDMTGLREVRVHAQRVSKHRHTSTSPNRRASFLLLRHS